MLRDMTKRDARHRHRHWPLRLCSGVLAALVLALAPALADARKPRHTPPRVPQGFIGVDASLPAGVDVPSQFNTMVASGVESVRLVFTWSAMQPYASFAQVPAAQQSSFVNAGGVPTTFAAEDRSVAVAAEHGFSVFAVVIGAPGWDSTPRPCAPAPASDLHDVMLPPDAAIRASAATQCTETPVPTRAAPYGNFLKALVGRYGPAGSFWRQNPGIPRHPIRLWCVWNEPNFLYNWGPQPFERHYVALLKVAHTAVKRADPGAKVVLAGVANTAWTTLAQIYKIRGARRYFDVVDIHPYTKRVSGVFTILRRVRAVMAKAGDGRKPIIVGEYTWPSSAGQSAVGVFDTQTTEAGQAKNVAAAMKQFAANRQRLRILATYYFTWLSVEYPGANTFNFAGLVGAHRGGQLFIKPALGAFTATALSLEHCKQKGSVATVCLRRGS